MGTASTVRIARVYDPSEPSDGLRVLVDRLWPRGMTTAAAALDQWLRDIAPSTELRHWYSHDPAKVAEFETRYQGELELAEPAAALAPLRVLCEQGPVSLLTASKALDISHAAYLARLVAR